MVFLNSSKKTEKIFWTSHSKMKMRYYGLSEKRVMKIFRKPDRKEEGIAPKTTAAMQVSGTKKNPNEVWMMYQQIKLKVKGQKSKVSKVNDCSSAGTCSKLRIISAWRYPGRTPENTRPIIPDDIVKEINTLIL